MHGYIIKSGVASPMTSETLEAYQDSLSFSAYISGHPQGDMILEKICRTFMLKNPAKFEELINNVVKSHPQNSLEHTSFLDIALECI